MGIISLVFNFVVTVVQSTIFFCDVMSCISCNYCLGADGNLARREFLNYALSLMRSHNDEHADSLPSLDISSMRHVAYVFDALIYYMRSGIDTDADVFRLVLPVCRNQDDLYLKELS